MGEATWWQRGVIYQIYPRSFMDGDGDGVGDLPGILARLDHLSWLGVDAVWLSPVHPSPMDDFGYDISDYTGVDPVFGTLADLDGVVAAAHERGLRVLLDWVPNHTSDRHPWFQASRSSRDDPRRDWYIWRDPRAGGGPPTNWPRYVGDSAWCWDERTGQYYYRVFLDSQPDLNWRNPQVQEAMFDTLRFWLARGIDGFRIDALVALVEDERLRDNPPNPHYRPGEDFPYMRELSIWNIDQPETRELAARMRKVVDEFGDDRVLLAELGVPLERSVAYYGGDGDAIQVPFNFELLSATWDARGIAGFVDRYLAALPAGAWPNWVLGNHDTPRVASRLGPAQARVAAMLLLTLPGTPILYQGEELGLTDVPIPPDQVLDPIAGLVPGRGRDPERTPMPWTAGPGGGFTTGRPWLPVGDDNLARNVAAQRDDPASMLSLHRRLLGLRRRTPALVTGTYHPVEADGDVLAYRRADGDHRCLVALNLGPRPARLVVPAEVAGGRVLVSTHPDGDGRPAGAPSTCGPTKAWLSGTAPDKGIVASHPLRMGREDHSSTTDGPRSLPDELSGLMGSASRRIWLKVPWWTHRETPGPARLFQELIAAARRGCEVRVLLRPEAGNRATLAALDREGVAVQALPGLHEKELLADDELLVHSANFTRAELHRSENAGYRITRAEDVQAAEEAFELFWHAAAGNVAIGQERWTKASALLPRELLPFFADTPKLNPMQAMALPVVLGTNGHVVVGASTGAGRTLVGAAAVLRAILLEDRKAIWLTPARSLAAGLDARFRRWQARGVRVVKLTGEERTTTPELRGAQLWVATSEQFESVCRRVAVGSPVDDVGCVVVDELHLIGSTTRGPMLEGLLARLRSTAQQTRLIGLSATVSNLDLLCTWLQAEKLESAFEPVPVLRQLVTYEPGTTSVFANRSKDLAVRALVAEARAADEPVLVFCGSRAGVMWTAAFLAGIPYGENWADLAASSRARGIGVLFGAAPEASAAAAAFRAGGLRVLVAATAVATGVNLPATVVIIRDDRLGLDPLTTDAALQLLGRAGSYGQADLGRGYLLMPAPEYGAWRQRLRAGHVVHSRILDQLEGAVLAEVLRGAVTTVAEARAWFAGTLAHAEGQAGNEPIVKALDLLLDNGFTTRRAERLVVTPLGRLTSQFLIDPVVAAEVLTMLGDLRIPSDPDDAESGLLATLAGAVPDLSDKSLLAATVALARPDQLAAPGDVEGVPVGELRELADQLLRYLGWLGALQLNSALDWPVPVAADLAQRLQYRRARPARGSGRLLRLLAATSRSSVPGRSPADTLLRLRAAGIHTPEQLDPDQLPPRLQRLEQDWPGFLSQRLTLELEGLDVEGDSLVLSLDGAADNLSVRLRVSAGELPEQVQLDCWSGGQLTIKAPSGVEHGQVAVELLAHSRHDWCYTSRRFSIDVDRLHRAADERARLLIGELPRQPPPDRRGWRPRLSEAQRRRHDLQTLFESDPDVLGPLAVHLAGDDVAERRVSRLVAAVNRLLVVRPDVIGDPSLPRQPASVLLAGSASPLERGLVIAMLLRALGYRVGLLTIGHRPSSVLPMVFTGQGWQTVEPPPQGRGAVVPLIPRRLDDGAPSVLRQPEAAQEPRTAWDLLASYRAVAPLPSQD